MKFFFFPEKYIKTAMYILKENYTSKLYESYLINFVDCLIYFRYKIVIATINETGLTYTFKNVR